MNEANNYFAVDDAKRMGGMLEVPSGISTSHIFFLYLSLFLFRWNAIVLACAINVHVCSRTPMRPFPVQFSANSSRNTRFLIWHLGVFVCTIMSLIG